jgi:hypothetical protein
LVPFHRIESLSNNYLYIYLSSVSNANPIPEVSGKCSRIRGMKTSRDSAGRRLLNVRTTAWVRLARLYEMSGTRSEKIWRVKMVSKKLNFFLEFGLSQLTSLQFIQYHVAFQSSN